MIIIRKKDKNFADVTKLSGPAVDVAKEALHKMPGLAEKKK